ncbi:MAG: hypothetical protein QGI45_15465, partial [Myxococcota bacterium]|nr:hypothetical protein [Myxococcota bacterium]
MIYRKIQQAAALFFCLAMSNFACTIQLTIPMDNLPFDPTGMSCPLGQLPDCQGNCVHADVLTLAWGDGSCHSNLSSEAHLNCNQYEWDGGDCCASTCNDANGDCTATSLDCLDENACEFADTCQSNQGAAEHQAANSVLDDLGLTGHPDIFSEDCNEGEISDCRGDCHLASTLDWLADDFCDDGTNPEYLVDFDCALFQFDGGDCAAQSQDCIAEGLLFDCSGNCHSYAAITT